jgi:hypothetical protein
MDLSYISNYANIKTIKYNQCCCLVETLDGKFNLETRHAHRSITVNETVLFSHPNLPFDQPGNEKYTNKLNHDFHSTCIGRDLSITCDLKGRDFIFHGNKIVLNDKKDVKKDYVNPIHMVIALLFGVSAGSILVLKFF